MSYLRCVITEESSPMSHQHYTMCAWGCWVLKEACHTLNTQDSLEHIPAIHLYTVVQ